MARTLRRAAAAATLLLVLPSTAAWADLDDYVVLARTDAVRIAAFESVVGSTLVEAGTTQARVASDPTAEASVTVLNLLGTPVLEGVSASSDGDEVRDPAEGDGCVLPVEAAGLTVTGGCLVAAAAGAPGGDATAQSASAEALVAAIGVDGSLLAALLTDSLDVLLEDLLGEIGDGALTDVIDQFTAACDALLPLDDEDDPSDEVPDTVQDLLDMTPAELDAAQEVLDTLEDLSCSALLDLSVGELSQDLVDVGPLADALDGVELLSLTLSGATSEVAGTGDAVDANAEQVLLTIDGPSLDFLDEVIVAIVQGAIDGIGQELADLAGQEFPEELDLADELADALTQVPLLGESAPLLEGVISGGSAQAAVERVTSLASGGGELPYAELAIAPSVIELLGGDPEQASVSLEAGQSQTLAADTPLESTLSLGDVIVEEVEDEATGLLGVQATTSVTSLDLLSGVEGGLDVTLGGSLAAAYGGELTSASVPDPDENLPRTGGGAVIAAVLALGAGLVLWRRRGSED